VQCGDGGDGSLEYMWLESGLEGVNVADGMPGVRGWLMAGRDVGD